MQFHNSFVSSKRFSESGLKSAKGDAGEHEVGEVTNGVVNKTKINENTTMVEVLLCMERDGIQTIYTYLFTLWRNILTIASSIESIL